MSRLLVSLAGIAVFCALVATTVEAAGIVVREPSLHKNAVRGLTVHAVCASSADYSKLLKTITSRRKRHNAAHARYKRKLIDRDLPRDKLRAQIRRVLRDIRNDRRLLARLDAEADFGKPLNVECRPYRKTTMVIDKNSAFGGNICVRPERSRAPCQWTDKRVFKSAYRPRDQFKRWVPNGTW